MASIDQGWSWVVLTASFSISGLLFGLSKCSGILYTVLPQMYGISRSQAATITTLFTSLMCACGVVSGMLLKYLSNRGLVIIAGITISLGLFVSSLAKTAPMFLLGYGIILAIGGGLSIVPSRMILMQYFDKKRNLAIGLSLTGSCVGGICMPPLMEKLEEKYGFSGTMLIFSGILLNIIPAALTFFPQNMKETEEIKTISTEVIKSKTPNNKKCSCPLDFSVLLDLHFLVIVMSTCCAMIGFSSINISFPDYAITELKVSRSQAALLLSAVATGDLIGRMFIALFNAKLHLKYSYMLGIILSASLTAMIPLISSFWALFACACAYGIAVGTTNVSPNLLINEYLEQKKWGPAYALNTMFVSIPIMATAPLIATLRDSMGSYVPCFLITSAVTFFAVTPWFCETCMQHKQKKQVYWLTAKEKEKSNFVLNHSEVALRSIF